MSGGGRYWVIAADPQGARVFAGDGSPGDARAVATIPGGADRSHAKATADALSLAYAAGRFDWLVLLAPQDFLEQLRSHLEPHIFMRVLAWLSREATPLPRDWLPDLDLSALHR